MKSNYEAGNIFKSKKQRTFRLMCTGNETVSFFEAWKIDSNGCIVSEFKNYIKDVFELEIQPTENQLLIKKSLSEIGKNILQISVSLQEMNNADAICSIGGNISLLELVLKKLNQKP